MLNRDKSFNRTTQLDNRLKTLCIICVYRDVEINWDNIINTFANKNPRRMVFIDILDDEKYPTSLSVLLYTNLKR